MLPRPGTQPFFTPDSEDRPLYPPGPFALLMSVLRQFTGETRLTLATLSANHEDITLSANHELEGITSLTIYMLVSPNRQHELHLDLEGRVSFRSQRRVASGCRASAPRSAALVAVGRCLDVHVLVLGVPGAGRSCRVLARGPGGVHAPDVSATQHGGLAARLRLLRCPLGAALSGARCPGRPGVVAGSRARRLRP
jgi:hypothetical protein